MQTTYLNSKINLKEYFVPTAKLTGEIRKAKVKNANLPFLQMMYNGDAAEPLRCLISGRLGWESVPDFGTGKEKKRFIIDFNHVRQRQNGNCQAGVSVDKGHLGDPSGWWRSRYLDPNHRGPTYSYCTRQKERELDVLEFMTIMPVTSEIHSFISQDSAKSNLTLQNYSKSTWAWCLKNKTNFNKTKKIFDIVWFDFIPYEWFIDHMSNIEYSSIRTRVKDLEKEFLKLKQSQTV
jgi:hypothetical protein